jgi:hypothetical protein
MKILLVLVSLLFVSVATANAAYTFKVHNTTKEKIVKILVSEDGKSWGNFDIGKGIGAGETMTLEWAESTNNEECSQYFKAVFEDKSESEKVKFDFCEEDLQLEF